MEKGKGEKGEKRKEEKSHRRKREKENRGNREKEKRGIESPLSPYPNGTSAYAFSAEMEYR